MDQIKKCLVIAKYTFLEMIKGRVMLMIVFQAFLLLLLCYIASEFTFAVPSKIILDIGMGLLSLSSIVLALFLGVGLLYKELENRTVYMVISRPVERVTFLCGKCLGLSSLLFLNILILGTVTFCLFLFSGGVLSSLFYWTLGFSFLEALIVLLLSILFSLVTGPILSVLYALILLVLGHAISDTLHLPNVVQNEALSTVIKVYSWICPDFSKLNLKDYLLYDQDLALAYLLSSLAYGLLYSFLLLVVCSIIFKKKNIY